MFFDQRGLITAVSEVLEGEVPLELIGWELSLSGLFEAKLGYKVLFTTL